MTRLDILLVAILSLPASASAEDKMVVDMNKMTCSELTKLGFQDLPASRCG